MKKNTQGFTLIELLVVIAIIGLLSSVVLAALNQTRAKARDTQRLSQAKEIVTAIELYIADKGYAPPLGGVSNCENPSSACMARDDNEGNAWNTLQSELSPYISSLPRDPKSGQRINDKYFGYLYQPANQLLGYIDNADFGFCPGNIGCPNSSSYKFYILNFETSDGKKIFGPVHGIFSI
jgi:prepilin-type N-terminal cleavage/methylation domain-containing protein